MVKSGFALQTLLHIVRLAAEGDIKTALKLGIREHQITELLTLSSQELHDISEISHSPFIHISFDPDMLETALRINERNSRRRKEILSMIRAGASFPVMKYLYGLSTEEMANYKKLAQIKCQGRPTRPSDAEQEELWYLLQPINSLDDPRLPQRLIHAHEKTGIRISSIWVLLNEWWDKKKSSDDRAVKLNVKGSDQPLTDSNIKR